DIQEDSAGHLDSRGFNAPVFYRYMSINVDMLKGRTIEEIRQLIKSFLYLVPTAMRSSFASDQRASFALLTCGEGNSTSLANAFSKSVRSGNNDILSASADKLISHYKKQKKAWGEVANESMFA
ncbi:type I-E CRISPR-associated protein Cas7/Cse4/CasC, partial [Klebsiella pneumoniae]|uniref:type I-E CRISPR-associated protein Cas7/Cse4/CasC n=1 Tax=Klebsiella pneumoniae TaxID=573 RepID=UPI0038519C2C